jgi:hypothetical protein
MGPAQHRSRRATRNVSHLTISRASCAVLLALLCAWLGVACTSSSVSSTSPSFQKCAVTLGDLAGSVGAGGGSATLAINTAPECTWTVTNTANWLSITPMSGQGSGQVSVQVAPNQDPATRQTDVMINGQRATFRQDAAPCQFAVSPQSIAAAATGGPATVTVTTASACSWTAVSNVPWVVVAGASGSGNGQVSLTLQANTGPARTGTVTIAGQAVTITQSAVGMTACAYALSSPAQSVPAAGGVANIGVTTSGGCAWSAVSSAPWIVVTAGAGGSGSGTVTLTIAANTGGARSGTVVIGGETFTVNQGGALGVSPCSFSINVGTQSIGANGGNGTAVTVTAGSGCAWTAVSNDPWITITSGASGTGGGTVRFTVAANTGGARSGTLTIAGQTFTVNQAAGATPCSYAINPTSQSIGSSGGTGANISVTAGGGCAWTAVSNAPWITVTSGSSGSGNGSVHFTVAANTDGARSGTITIAGQTFTVSQGAAACPSSINPTTQSIAAGASSGNSIAVAADSSCSWTAVSNASWLTVSGSGGGTGNGSFSFAAAANSGPQRTGTITVGEQTLSVTQASGCAFTVSPLSETVGGDKGPGQPITVTTTAGCSWTASTTTSWISITSGASGNGPGTVQFTVDKFNGNQRSGSLTVAGQTVSITQRGN